MKPHFLILGAQKAGTNSLYRYLCQHPQILPATEKEIHFFSLHYERGLSWYQSQFPISARGEFLFTGEGTPYYLFHPFVPERVFKTLPQVKLIVLLRNPVDRAISHYYWEVKLGYEPLSLSEAIAQEPQRLQGETEKLLSQQAKDSFNHQHYSYLARGCYADQLQIWFRYFSPEQFLILESQALYTRTSQILAQVFHFLGVPDYRLPHYRAYNAGSYPGTSPQLRQRLAEYFKPHNHRLKLLLSKDFDWQ